MAHAIACRPASPYMIPFHGRAQIHSNMRAPLTLLLQSIDLIEQRARTHAFVPDLLHATY
jgi:hypothetical protein